MLLAPTKQREYVFSLVAAPSLLYSQWMALVSRPHFSLTMLDFSSHVTRLDRFNALPMQRVASRIALWTDTDIERCMIGLQNDRHMS